MKLCEFSNKSRGVAGFAQVRKSLRGVTNHILTRVLTC